MKITRVLISTLLLANSAYAGIDDGLVGHWPLDGNAIDVVGGFNGTIYGQVTPVEDRDGNAGGAMWFSGVDTNGRKSANGVLDYITTPFSPAINQGEALSISVWIKGETQLDYYGYVFGLERTNSQQFSVGVLNDTGKPGFAFRQDNYPSYGECCGVSGNTNVLNTGWHYIVGVRDPASDTLKLYIDGVLENTVADNSVVGMNVSAPISMAIGADHNSTFGITQPFRGAIDDVRVYNRALSNEEIAYYFNPVTTVSVVIDSRINLSSSGVVPVTILSTADFDASTVVPETVSLAGASVKMVGKSGKYLCSIEDVNSDGLNDMNCKVETAQFLIEPGQATAILEASTIDGLQIRGESSIEVVNQ